MFVLLLKVTVFLLAGLISLGVSRRSTAALRHLLCVCTLAGSLLLLPAAALLPSKTIAFQTAALGRSTAIARVAALPRGSAIPALWAVGTALLLLRLALGYWRAGRVVRAATPVEPPVFAAGVSVPMVAGLFRPAVLLPHAAAAWPNPQRAAAVRHELAHIARNDLWTSLAAHLACALYWFHPLVWLVSAHLRREQEAACDDAVLHSGFDPAAYAEALLAVSQNSTSTLIQGCPMTTQTNLKSRIARLLDRRIARTASTATLLRAATAFAGILLVFAAWSPVRAQTVYKAGGDVTMPSVIYKVDPAYTEDASRDKIQGAVLLSIVVGADGLAHDIGIAKGLNPGLDARAAEAVQQWRFAPGTLKGEPVAVRATIQINFKLR